MVIQVIHCCSSSVGASTILLESNAWIIIQKGLYIWVQDLMNVGIGSEGALHYLKGGFGIKGDPPQIICLSLSSMQA